MSKPANQYKIAIIGPADVVSGFRALGVETFPAYSPDEALEQLRHIKQLSFSGEAYAVVCIIEDLMIGMDEKEYKRVLSSSAPKKEQADFSEGKVSDGSMKVGNGVKETQSASYLPAVVILPGTSGSQGFAEARLRKLSEKAIGASII